MEIATVVLLTCVFGLLPFLGLLLWWWNEIWYALPLKFQLSGTASKLPPGHMGFPLFGEMLSFLFYFKILRRPDDFIDSKRRKYGDGVGLYRSHLFGSPCLIACLPAVNKFILKSDDIFIMKWFNVELVGQNSLVAVHGEAHTRLRSYVINAINSPAALRCIADVAQPRILAALQSWAEKGKINTHKEVKKVTFENTVKYFASLEPGPAVLDAMSDLFKGLVKGFRAYPLNIPGTAHHHAHQCRTKLEAIFRGELEKKKRQGGARKTIDLMDGLMQMKDEVGNLLSDQEVLHNIVSLVVGGFESTTLASMWAIYYLAKYPDVLKKLREENIALSKKKEGDFITSTDVSKLTYTNKVVEETIRMANIAVFVTRFVTKQVEYKGYTIPRNWRVMVWLRYLHTSPENFDDPMCFNPDRWNEPARPGTYQVFGMGSRLCAGNMLARMEMTILLHHLSVGYKWELLNPDADMVYLPHPVPVDGIEIAFSKI